ncbi:MAG: HAD family hydrolase [Alphaproteobacteria bacterium]|nr:HAD family hydrolase [Alphaproteobacteria bacterium]
MICNKIGVDFHGVINCNPLFFKEFCDCAIKHGFEIHIISGGPCETIKNFLAQYQIKHNIIWCIFDHFNEQEKVVFLPDGSFHVDDELWDSAKAEYCLRNNICVMIDDSLVYGKYFTTPYCLYDEHKKSGKLSGSTIDFSLSAEKSMREILSVLN